MVSSFVPFFFLFYGTLISFLFFFFLGNLDERTMLNDQELEVRNERTMVSSFVLFFLYLGNVINVSFFFF